MKKYLFLLLTLFALVSNADSQNYPLVITAAGGSVVIQWPYATNTIYITTNGVVNLSPTYSLNNADLPPVGQFWYVRFNASKLTVTSPTNVNLFGVYPEKDYPGQPTYVIYYEVMYDSTNSNTYLFYQYISTTPAIQNITYTANFRDTANFSGPVTFDDPTVTTPSIGAAVVAKDVKGRLQYGCVPWCTQGNSGLAGTHPYLGPTDTVPLMFKDNGSLAGFVSSLSANTVFGYQAGNPGISGNTLIGYQAMNAGTTGNINTFVGSQAGLNTSTGGSNVGIGENALVTNISGSSNTAVGTGANVALPNSNSITAIGVNATASSFGIALGANATASPNQFTINGIRGIYIPNMPSGLYYSLQDTSGNGNFEAVPLYSGSTFTPVTGDSITIVNTQNTLNAAGTIANLTIILPANPQSWKVYNFSSTQAIGAIAYSTRLSGGTVSGFIPTSASGFCWGVYWNPDLSEWILAHK